MCLNNLCRQLKTCIRILEPVWDTLLVSGWCDWWFSCGNGCQSRICSFAIVVYSCCELFNVPSNGRSALVIGFCRWHCFSCPYKGRNGNQFGKMAWRSWVKWSTNKPYVNWVQQRIQAGWIKWRSVSGVLCDRRMPIKLKGKIHNTITRPALLYDSEIWTQQAIHTLKMQVTENKMLRWSGGMTTFEKVRNEHLYGSLGIGKNIKAKLDERQLSWFGHCLRRETDHITQRQWTSRKMLGDAQTKRYVAEKVQKENERSKSHYRGCTK